LCSSDTFLSARKPSIGVHQIGGGSGTAGVAVASFKRFEFLDDNGIVQETELTSVSSFVEVQRCVSITIALDLVAATGCGGWSFYWLS
jgi:hypothetical protein